jgi:hypothetical protein
LVADGSYQIEAAPEYTYSSDSAYWDLGLEQYTSSESFASFGALDFNGSSLAGKTVTTASLGLYESNFASSTHPLEHSGPTVLTFWAVPNNTAVLTYPGNTSIGYLTGGGAVDGYLNQLGTPVKLGTYDYTSTGSTPDKLDTINFTTGLSALTSLIDTTSGDIRIVVTSDQLGYATFVGAKSGTPNAPVLNITVQAVPEPATVAAFAIGGIALFRRRKIS